MSDREPKPGQDDLSPLQSIVWKTAAAVEVVCMLVFGKHVTGFQDPVVVVIFLVAVSLCVWLTRLWVRTSITDEFIRSLLGGRK